MQNLITQVRGAVSLLNPDEVRRRADRELNVGVLAGSAAGYAALENLLAAEPGSAAVGLARAGGAAAPAPFDVVLATADAPAMRGAIVLDAEAPERTLERILDRDDDLLLPLARRFPLFRKAAVDRIVHAVARENAMFALATALPNVVPSLIELPWAVTEFATDTAFLTMNQVRMAFLVAGACGRGIGFVEQKVEVLSIFAGAFGWRAIARELAGKIPMGGGLIPKAGIAWAGTFVIGKGLEHFNSAGRWPTRNQRRALYADAYSTGKRIAAELADEVRGIGI